MTEAGLEIIEGYLNTRTVNWTIERDKKDLKQLEFQVPDFIFKALAENEPALINFNNLAQYYKRQYINWITYAKRNETIQNRLNESIRLLKENKKLGLQ